MARILCAWELGGNYGHLTQLLPLVRRLAAAHELILALPDGVDAGVWLDGGLRVRQVAAPLRTRRRPAPPPASYADILHAYAFRDPATLGTATAAWDKLIAELRPDAVLLNAAPLASLAARRAGVKRFVVGDGFALPPLVAPLPQFRSDAAQNSVAEIEASVVEAANALLPSGCRVAFAHDLARGDLSFLATLPPLDHYRTRQGEEYAGPLYETGSGISPSWPNAKGPKVYAYLRTGSRESRLIDEALRLCEAQALRYAGHPARMNDVLAECDLVVCHGGHGTVASTLLAGKPLLLLPQHLEQLLTARNLVTLGAGLAVAPKEKPESVAAKLQTLLRDSHYQHAAARFMGAYFGRNSDAAAGRIVAAIEASI